MLFAQTGTAVSLPSKPAQKEVDPAMIALWWIVPLVIAAIAIALKVRANQVNESRRQAQRKEDAAKLKGNAKGMNSKAEPKPESQPVQHNDSQTNELPSARPLSQTKSKKEKNKGKSKPKPIVTTQPLAIASERVADTPAPVQAVNSLAENAVPTSAANTSTSEPKPSNAIFEPLRDATKAKRKPAIEESFDERAQKTESASRANDAYNQLFGGKFERIIPKQTLRSTANRWPAPETPPTRIAPRVIESSAPSELQLNAPSSVEPTSPSTPAAAPAKGLKSFVSKVKSQPINETESGQSTSAQVLE